MSEKYTETLQEFIERYPGLVFIRTKKDGAQILGKTLKTRTDNTVCNHCRSSAVVSARNTPVSCSGGGGYAYCASAVRPSEKDSCQEIPPARLAGVNTVDVQYPGCNNRCDNLYSASDLQRSQRDCFH